MAFMWVSTLVSVLSLCYSFRIGAHLYQRLHKQFSLLKHLLWPSSFLSALLETMGRTLNCHVQPARSKKKSARVRARGHAQQFILDLAEVTGPLHEANNTQVGSNTRRRNNTLPLETFWSWKSICIGNR